MVQLEPVDDVGRLELSSLVAVAASEGLVFIATLLQGGRVVASTPIPAEWTVRDAVTATA